MHAQRPARVTVTRDVAESYHDVDIVVGGIDGPSQVWGDEQAPIIPRSAIKFVQAIPLVRTGAADAHNCSEVELALAAASHSAEPEHVSAVRAWLDRIGFDETILECGPDRPIDQAAADCLIRSGTDFGPIFNCCSGKHAGFLTIARHLDVEPSGYIERNHPVQHLVTEAIEQFCDVDLGEATNGADGCGIPTFSIPARNLTLAMARFADPSGFDAPTQAAVDRLQRALGPNAWFISGTGRPEVTLGAAASETILLKGGAEGVFMGALVDRGIGIALKSRDGSRRGADAAMAAVLAELGVVPAAHARSVVTNKAGTVVGEQSVELQ